MNCNSILLLQSKRFLKFHIIFRRSKSSFLVCRVTLVSEDGLDERGHYLNEHNKIACNLSGSIYEHGFSLYDKHGKRGTFFVFPNICIRLDGVYRLRFDMFDISLYYFMITDTHHK